jgi:hypothetical protein
MVNTSIDVFEMSYEESFSYFKLLENLEKISGPFPSTLPVDNKKMVSVPNSLGKSSKSSKASSMCCHYCDMNNHNTADCRAISKFKQQIKTHFEAKSRPGRIVWPSF